MSPRAKPNAQEMKLIALYRKLSEDDQRETMEKMEAFLRIYAIERRYKPQKEPKD